MWKVLWLNPSFLDYRIPLYEELYQKLNGNFHLLYSKQRIPERCHKRVNQVLGENAHYITQEKILEFGKKTSGFANSFLSIPFPSGLYSHIKNIKPSVIIAEGFFQFTPWALAYTTLHHIPLYIAYERTAHTERHAPFWRRFYRKFVGLFVKGYIANGSLTKEYLMSQGVKEHKIVTGGMCADSEQLRNKSSSVSGSERTEFLQSIGLNHIEGIRYIYVGRIISVKGVKYLLESWTNHINKHPHDELLIVGNGDLLDEYKERFENVNSIKFIGYVDYSQIYKYYSISDVFIIPTLEDNWSLVVPEAMACGLPIACSIYNGCHPELVLHDVNGTTFDPLIKNSVLDALDYFHNKNLKDMGMKSIEIEKKYNPAQVADNVIKAISQDIDNK